MNIQKKPSRTIPSLRVSMLVSFPVSKVSRARDDRMILASMHNGMSFCTVSLDMMMGERAADAPAITITLNKLLPTMLLTLSVVAELSFEMLARKLTMNSGSDVPKATIVSPMTISDTPNRSAKPTAPSVSLSAPMRTKVDPMIVYNI